MATSAGIALVLAALLVAANLPFVNERLFVIGPRRRPAKALGWRLAELACYGAVAVGLGFAVEAGTGQRQPQGWEFYAAMACLLLTCAFPGFVWRYLRRRP